MCDLSHSPVVSPCLSACKCGTTSCYLPFLVLQPHLAAHTFHPHCLSPPLLSVWMNVSSLTPWLSDFHTVRFSGSFGCFLFLNLLLSFSWLCEEAVYLPTSPSWLEVNISFSSPFLHSICYFLVQVLVIFLLIYRRSFLIGLSSSSILSFQSPLLPGMILLKSN